MIDFFKEDCKTETNAEKFGICDDTNVKPAYINTENSETWIASVLNPDSVEITFFAIDNCVEILRADGSTESRCDGMLVYDNKIAFIELKQVKKKWIPDGIQQLKITIENFVTNQDVSVYERKRAYLANSKHPQFKYSHKEAMQRFRHETGFRLIIGNQIKV